jgi:hypothetical protein
MVQIFSSAQIPRKSLWQHLKKAHRIVKCFGEVKRLGPELSNRPIDEKVGNIFLLYLNHNPCF